MTPLPDPPKNSDSELDDDRSNIIVPTIISSDEDEPSNNEYQPLPQEEEHTDLSSLLTALNSYGVNNISEEETDSNETTTVEDNSNEIYSVRADAQCTLTKETDETNKEHKTELTTEQAQLWNDNDVHNFELSKEKESAIKNAMANFTLPATNVPQWAFNVSDEEWRCKISQITNT